MLNDDLMSQMLAGLRPKSSNRSKVMAKIDELHKRTLRLYGEGLPRFKVEFDLRGRTAGMMHSLRIGEDYEVEKVRFNEAIMNTPTNTEQFLARTVPHEFAHAVQYGLFNGEAEYRQAHGKGWRNIMRDLGVEDVTRCHTYDTKAARRGNYYPYKCDGCGYETEFSQRRHNKVLRGQALYGCGKCGGALVCAA